MAKYNSTFFSLAQQAGHEDGAVLRDAVRKGLDQVEMRRLLGSDAFKCNGDRVVLRGRGRRSWHGEGQWAGRED